LFPAIPPLTGGRVPVYNPRSFTGVT